MQRTQWIWCRSEIWVNGDLIRKDVLYLLANISFDYLILRWKKRKFINSIFHVIGRHWALESSLCWGGVTEESPLWLQQRRAPTSSARWLYGDPMPLFPSRTSTFMMVLQLYFSLSLITASVVPNFVNCAWFNLSGFLWQHTAVRDVSKWSARMRKPMEDVYGAEVFAKTWEAWVNGIAQFAKRPEGTQSMLLQTYNRK